MKERDRNRNFVTTLLNDAVPYAIKVHGVLLFLLTYLVAGCLQTARGPLFPGRWSFASDVAEYHGLYVFDFTPSGKLVLEDYAEGFKPGDPPSSVTQAGQYSLLADNQISILDTNGQERALYRIDVNSRRLVYLRGAEKSDVQLVRPSEYSRLYSPE